MCFNSETKKTYHHTDSSTVLLTAEIVGQMCLMLGAFAMVLSCFVVFTALGMHKKHDVEPAKCIIDSK